MNLVGRAINKVERTARFYHRKRLASKKGIRFAEPDYIYLDWFEESSIVIDVGCGHVAEFSRHVINQYGVTAFGVDPTRKHAPHLRALEEETNGRFRHVPLAVASIDGQLTFNESLENESGSVLDDHTNVKADQIMSYEVESVTLKRLLERIGAPEVDYIKLDLEGAEYELLLAAQKNDLAPFRQIFVEFHHHAVDRYSEADTRDVVESFKAMGLQDVTFDDHNYLFYWE